MWDTWIHLIQQPNFQRVMMACLLLGTAVAAWLSSICITIITKYSRIKQDAVLGIALTSFYGLGIVLLTRVAHSGVGN